MAYLVDTNILIYHLNGVVTATQLIDRLLESGAAMSAISYAEIVEGLQGERHSSVVEMRLTALAEHVKVLAFTQDEATIAGQVRHTLREGGGNVRSRPLDLLIAATALLHDLTLVTNDPSDFVDVPSLRVQVADIRV